MLDPTGVINNVRQLSWDAPYRLVASLAGLAAVAAGGPLDATRRVVSWLGFSVASDVTEVENWLLEPSRREVLVPASVGLVVAAAASIWAYGRLGMPNAESRAGATLVLAYAVLVQLGSWPSYVLLLFLAGSIAAWLGMAWRGRDGDRFLAVWLDTFLALLWAPLVLGGWALLRESLVPASAGPAGAPAGQTALADGGGPAGAVVEGSSRHVRTGGQTDL